MEIEQRDLFCFLFDTMKNLPNEPSIFIQNLWSFLEQRKWTGTTDDDSHKVYENKNEKKGEELTLFVDSCCCRNIVLFPLFD